MRRRRLLWQLFPSYLFITLLSLAAVALYSLFEMRNFYLERVSEGLEARAYLLEEQFTSLFDPLNATEIDRLCKRIGKSGSTRITIVLPNGRVVGDTDELPSRMENHSDRPEIQAAFRGETGRSMRRSPTIRSNMMYVAIPLMKGDEVIAVVRTSLPLISIGRALSPIYYRIVLAGIVVALIAAGISLYIARRISLPLEQMRQVAKSYAQGDFKQLLPVSQSVEIHGLAQSMSEMAKQLDERISTITSQGSEQAAILKSMVEGVLAIDISGKIISINRAAEQMLGLDAGLAPGKSVLEAIRNSDLQDFVARALSGDERIEAEFSLRTAAPKSIQAHGTSLIGKDGRRVGAVIVLNDITHIKRLEKIRSDFVANVSHELKTPVTSIKGFVETLIEGAMNEPDDAARFLGIVAKQVERLNSILEDLLLLSRIEQETGTPTISLDEQELCAFLEAAAESCIILAEDKNISIVRSCAGELKAKINRHLLEAALINLVDNAVKYSEPGSSIEMGCMETDDAIELFVRDHGIGIEPVHFPRLFERFYRVDKGRSRDLGGTGLGLAIVKHIAQAHGGRVGVESIPGKGSTFTLYLPKKK